MVTSTATNLTITGNTITYSGLTIPTTNSGSGFVLSTSPTWATTWTSGQKVYKGKYVLRCPGCGRWAKIVGTGQYQLSHKVTCKRCGVNTGMVKIK